MSPLPDASLNIVSNGLGLAVPGATGTQVKIGCSSAGTANQPAIFSDSEALKTAFGTGPMVEAALVALRSGKPVICCKVPSSTPGAAGTVTETKTGTGTMTVAGGARDSYDVVVQFTAASGGTLVGNSGLFKISKDGGRTWGNEYALPDAGTFEIPNTGLTLTFTIASGAGFASGDKFAFTCTPPASTLAEVQAAIDAVKAAALDFEFIHVVGAPAPAGEAAMFAALDAKATGFITDHVYQGAFIVMEAPAQTDAANKAAFTTKSDFVAVCAGGEYLSSPIDGRLALRNVAWGATARAAAIDLGTDPARVLDGPIAGVTALVRDESSTPALDQFGFTTMRTYKRRTGFYLTNARMFSQPTSDFRYWQHRRIMNSACAAAYDVLIDQLHNDVLVDIETGLIDEGEAKSVEAKAERAVRDRLGKAVSGVTVTVDRTVNVLSTSELSAAIDIVPKGYLKAIRARVGFKNPALAAAE